MSKKTPEEELADGAAEIVMIIIAAIIFSIIIGLLVSYNSFSFFHDLGESTGTGGLPFFIAIFIVIASCVGIAAYGEKTNTIGIGFKKCPYCGKKVNKIAEQCPYCRRML